MKAEPFIQPNEKVNYFFEQHCDKESNSQFCNAMTNNCILSYSNIPHFV